MRSAFRAAWPLLPAWVALAIALATSATVWEPAGPSLHGDAELAQGWLLLGALVVASAAYLLAPVLGPCLGVVTPSSADWASATPTGGQARFGTGVVRFASLGAAWVVALAALLA